MIFHTVRQVNIFHFTFPIVISALFVFSCGLLLEETKFYTALLTFISMPVANIFCITLPSLFISSVAGKAFLLNKSFAVLFLGNAFLLSGIGSLVAGCMLFFTGSVNILITIHNVGALLSAFFLLVSSWLYFSPSPLLCTQPRRALAGFYTFTLILLFSLAIVTTLGLTPIFFIKNQGPTFLRQSILIITIIFYFQAALLLFFKYLRIKSRLILWYMTSLVFIAFGLIIIFLEQSIGSVINVTGRLLQYLGHVYATITVWAILRQAKAKRTVAEVLASFFFDAETNYQILLETVPFAILTTDAEGQILIWNLHAETLFEIEKAKAIGQELSHLLPIKNKRVLKKTLFPKHVNLTMVAEIDFTTRKIPVEVYIASCETDYGCINTYIFIDLTSKKQYEAEIFRLNNLDMLGQMADSIAHEVRNPITTVRGFLRHYSRNLLDEKKNAFGLLIEELDRANSIITEYLLLSRNKAPLLEEKSLSLLVTELRQLFEAYALEEGKNIIIEVAAEKETILTMDVKEIKQLLANLVRNALEATPPQGLIKVLVYREENYVVLSVEDNGTGIEPEILAKLGTPFLTTKSRGTGLGLSICYCIAARHHAEITVSTSTKGTMFIVRFLRTNITQ